MRYLPTLTAVSTAVWMTASVIAADRRVTLTDLPVPVQEAVRQYTDKGSQVMELEEETEDGKTLYDVELRTGGKTREIVFDATGKVIEAEMEVSIDSIPEAARATLQKMGEITELEAVTEDGITVYEAHVTKDGKTSEVIVGADGTMRKQ